MKKYTLLTLIFFLQIIFVDAQNPASPIKDSTLSMPEKTFEVFWQTFEDNYAFFELRNMNWESAYKKYRPKVDATTTDDSLFSILSEMVAPLHDDHVNIIIPGVKEFTAEKPSPFLQEFPEKSVRDLLWSAVDTTLYKCGFAPLSAVGPEYRGKQLFYYSRSDKYGYIRMERCFASDATYEDTKADTALAGRLLDSILQQLDNTEALILDIRSNIGGDDEFAYAIAGRFATRKILGHSKQTRISGTDKFTKLENWYITPLTSSPYTNPVMVLTNDQTASAGDVLAMIMRVLPQATLVGVNTLGIYSDMYGFELPNKWLVSLSNQKYFSSEMVSYEGKGTPVDIQAHNSKKDIVLMKDPVVLAAMDYLKKSSAKK